MLSLVEARLIPSSGYTSKGTLNGFLAHFENPDGVRTVADLIEFNKNHSDLELPHEHPGQEALIAALDKKMTADEHGMGLKHSRSTAQKAIMKSLQDNRIDVF